MMSQQQEQYVEINGRMYEHKRAHLMLTITKLVDVETGEELKSVNQNVIPELRKKNYDWIGFGGVGYWGKLEV